MMRLCNVSHFSSHEHVAALLSLSLYIHTHGTILRKETKTLEYFPTLGDPHLSVFVNWTNAHGSVDVPVH